jgi:phosphatidylglycerophosphate synthase
MNQRIVESQKPRDVLAAFLARKVSCHVTALLVRTPITPNQTTVLWGAIGALNSFVVYRVLIGEFWLLPVVVSVYVFTYVLDCVDGEIARFRNIADPIGGKLIDGICHRITEYSLLMSYVAAASELTGSPWALPIGLTLLSGEAMYTYSYERRMATMRLDLGYKGTLRTNVDKMYTRGDRWRDLSWRQKLETFKPMFQYKSAYAVIAVGYVSGVVLLVGLAFLAIYKHAMWMRLVARTLAATRQHRADAAAAEPTTTPRETIEVMRGA